MENEAERQNYELEAERVRQEMNARLGTSNEGIFSFFSVFRKETWELKKKSYGVALTENDMQCMLCLKMKIPKFYF